MSEPADSPDSTVDSDAAHLQSESESAAGGREALVGPPVTSWHARLGRQEPLFRLGEGLGERVGPWIDSDSRQLAGTAPRGRPAGVTE